MGLDVLLAGTFDMGVRGIALGTLIAEWVAAVWGLWLVLRMMSKYHGRDGKFFGWSAILQLEKLRTTLIANGNIMIRTLAMLTGMAWVTRQGVLLGETVLAANHLLIGIISFCAFFLDGVIWPDLIGWCDEPAS